MEPKKKLKKHDLVKPKWEFVLSNNNLITLLDEMSSQIHPQSLNVNSRNIPVLGNWVHSDLNVLFNDNITLEIGDWKIEGDTYVQDITLTPSTPTKWFSTYLS